MKYTFLFLLFFVSVYSQEFPDKSKYYSFGEKFYSEIHLIPHQSSDSINVLLLFKISNNAIQFMQSDDVENKNRFFAVPNFESYYKDETGIIRGRVLWKDTVYVYDYDITTSKSDYVSSYSITTLKKGKFTGQLKLIGKFMEVIDSKDIEFDANEKSQTLNSYKPIITEQLSKNIYKPFILNGNIPFGVDNVKAFFYLKSSDELGDLAYRIYNLKTEEELLWKGELDISGRVENLGNSSYQIENENNPIMRISDESITDNYRLLMIDLPSSQFFPGNYRLVIKRTAKDTTFVDFKVKWDNMPLSLKNPEYASKSMYYILEDEEYKPFIKGSKQEIMDRIIGYWKKQDPTPETPYNEAMNAYFSRVDYAFFNFKTLTNSDGSKTERGKIYILFGAPDEFKDELVDGKTRQVWTYNKLNQKFVFEAISVGNYRLVEVIDLAEKQD